MKNGYTVDILTSVDIQYLKKVEEKLSSFTEVFFIDTN